MRKRAGTNLSKPRGASVLLRSVWAAVFGRLDFQKDVVAPVTEKLTVGLIVFAVLATGKEWIYPLLFRKPSATDFPIYATGEAFTNPASRLVEGEIYLMNLIDRSLTEEAQQSWLVAANEYNPRDVDTQFYVHWRSDGSHMTLMEDEPFNRGKGRLELIEPKGRDRTWRIRVIDINRRALLRIKITTDYEAPLTRGDKINIPFQIQGPRSITQ